MALMDFAVAMRPVMPQRGEAPSRPALLKTIFMCVIFTPALIACGPPDSASGASVPGQPSSANSTPDSAGRPAPEIKISCYTAYRAGVTSPVGKGSKKTVSPSAAVTTEYPDLTFSANNMVWFGEGQSLKLAVTVTGQAEELTAILYQFQDNKPVANPFKGGHGFTGLHYAYHPVTRAELQFWCAAEE